MQQETLKAILVSLISAGKVKPSVEDLGRELGLSLTEVKEVVPDTDPANSLDPGQGPEGGERRDDRATRPERTQRGKGTDKTRNIGGAMAQARTLAASMAARVAEQHSSSRHSGPLTLGHTKQARDLLGEQTDLFYAAADSWLAALADVEDSVSEFRARAEQGLAAQFERMLP